MCMAAQLVENHHTCCQKYCHQSSLLLRISKCTHQQKPSTRELYTQATAKSRSLLITIFEKIWQVRGTHQNLDNLFLSWKKTSLQALCQYRDSVWVKQHVKVQTAYILDSFQACSLPCTPNIPPQPPYIRTSTPSCISSISSVAKLSNHGRDFVWGTTRCAVL